MSAVLLTGASGYAGGAILAALQHAGLAVVTAGRHAAADLSLDLSRPQDIAGLRPSQPITACVHAAAAHEVQCREDPVAAWTTNVTATRALLQAAAAAGASRFVYISTFHVFGRPRGLLDEHAMPTPANDYGLTHLAAENLLRELAPAGMAVTVLRPSNLFGIPAQWGTFDRWTLAPFDFMRQAARQGRIMLLSDGSPVRNYVSLESLARAVLSALRGDLAPCTHVAGRNWGMAQLAEQAARAWEQSSGASVAVQLGGRTEPAADWVFGSLVLPAETDDEGAAMRQFLLAAARHMKEART